MNELVHACIFNMILMCACVRAGASEPCAADHDGKLTKEELKSFLLDINLGEVVVSNLLKIADDAHDGRVEKTNVCTVDWLQFGGRGKARDDSAGMSRSRRRRHALALTTCHASSHRTPSRLTLCSTGVPDARGRCP